MRFSEYSSSFREIPREEKKENVKHAEKDTINERKKEDIREKRKEEKDEKKGKIKVELNERICEKKKIVDKEKINLHSNEFKEKTKELDFKDIAEKIHNDLKINNYPFKENDKSVAGIIHLSSVISNEQIKKKDLQTLPEVSKKESHETIKDIIKHVNADLIENLLEENKLDTKNIKSLVGFIADHDNEHSIRVIDLPDSAIDKIWNNLSIEEKQDSKMKRYFKYRYDNPPLSTVVKYLPNHEKYIDNIKGHGVSQEVKIPTFIDDDLAYLVGAMRDGGVHYDINNDAYKIHYEQEDRKYLENEIQPRLERVFDLETRIEKRKDRVHQIQIASKPIHIIFSKLFEVREIQQFWDTPQLIKDAPPQIKKEYIRGFYDAEGTPEHIYHSWFRNDKCPPLEFISNVLNEEFDIKTTKPLKIKINELYNRFPAYQLFINDYKKFKEEILENP